MMKPRENRYNARACRFTLNRLWSDEGWRPLRWIITAFLILLSLSSGAAFSGCSSRPARINSISVDPSSLASQVIADFDTDSNGNLSAAELEKIPPIHQNWTEYDTDKNSELSAAELEARFKRIFDPSVGVLPANCNVTRNGRPISGAEVRFVPPEFLEGTLPVASGVTNDNGTAALSLSGDDVPKGLRNTRVTVMRPGLYLVEVTHPTLKIPPQYNTQTTLGKEVSSEVMKLVGLPIDLKF